MQANKPTFLSRDPWYEVGSINAPALTLPDGKIHITSRKRVAVSVASMIGRCGVKAVKDSGAPTQYQYMWSRNAEWLSSGIGPTPNVGNEASAYDETTVRNLARSKPCVYAEGNDFQEGVLAMPETSSQFQWWMDERRLMYQNPSYNPNGYTRRDHGGHGSPVTYQGGVGGRWRDSGGGNVSPVNSYYINMYAGQAAARAMSAGYHNTIEPLGVGTNLKFYCDRPDYAVDYYIKKHAMEIIGKGLGKAGGLGPGYLTYTPWGKVEGIDPAAHDLHNNIYTKRRITSPAGYAVTTTHPRVDYDYYVGCVFILGFVMCSGYVPFDDDERYGADPNLMTTLNPAGNPNRDRYVGWEPDVAGTSAPVVSSGGFYEEPCRWIDAGYEAAYYYSQMDRTAGQPWQYMSYKEGSGSFISVQSNGTDILYHAAANDGPHATFAGARRGRGDCMYRVSGNALDWFYFDPSRPKTDKRTITAQVGGSQFQIPNAKGMTLYVMRETI
nr:hypothetical protein [uncultured Arsenicibacter sp.]